MRKLSPEATHSLLDELRAEKGENLRIDAFTFHFVSNAENDLNELSVCMELLGFRKLRLVPARGGRDLVMELQRDGDLALEALQRVDFLLSVICEKWGTISYMGCTPIGELPPRERK